MSSETADALVDNPFAAFEDKADTSVPSATLQIYTHIDHYLKRESDTSINRASAATMCVKRRQYKRLGALETPLTPRKMVNFLLGDLSERALLYFIKQACVGPGKLYSEVDFGDIIGSIQFQGKSIDIYVQKTMSFKLDDFTVTGHADGFGKRNSDGKWELIEIKSAANWGFKDFQESGAGDYLRQSHALMLTDECRKLEIKSVRFFYLKKETGHIWDRSHDYQEIIAKQVVKEYRIANRDDAIEPPFALKIETAKKRMEGKGMGNKWETFETGKMTAEFPCSYCPYLAQCHGDFTIEWKADQWGNKKPVYVFNKE